MLELMCITNDIEVAKILDENGVERIWVDLETMGKEERQKGYDSVKSQHTIQDIKNIKPVLRNAKLQVRINPIHKNSKHEIDEVINSGADIIMLPYYKTIKEVEEFSNIVKGRTKTVLLLETKEAHECLEETLKVAGIDEIHIGLNDLHLSYGKTFMFEVLSDGTVEDICKKIQKSGKQYGVGGIAKLGAGMLPAENVIMEHYRLGSTRAILSRSFCMWNDYESLEDAKMEFAKELKRLREYEKSIQNVTLSELDNNRIVVADSVKKIVKKIKEEKSRNL